MARESPGQTLQPTALVHEAYLRTIAAMQTGWDGRGHFFAAAAEADAGHDAKAAEWRAKLPPDDEAAQPAP